MSEKKPQPLIPTPSRSRCPVCGEISYSRAGVHPQCSVRKEDQQRTKRSKREALAAKQEKAVSPTSGVSAWQKRCPKCEALQHVRKLVCGCGHVFAAKARPPTSGGEPG